MSKTKSYDDFRRDFDAKSGAPDGRPRATARHHHTAIPALHRATPKSASDLNAKSASDFTGDRP